MKKRIIIAIFATTGVIVLSQDSVINAIVSFLLVGAIPGTQSAVPFWIMIAGWCLVITTVTTIYIESILGFLRSENKHDVRRARMPRRRYSEI